MLYGMDIIAVSCKMSSLMHSLRMCLPLDDPREFLETEKEFFSCLKGDGEQTSCH